MIDFIKTICFVYSDALIFSLFVFFVICSTGTARKRVYSPFLFLYDYPEKIDLFLYLKRKFHSFAYGR